MKNSATVGSRAVVERGGGAAGAAYAVLALCVVMVVLFILGAAGLVAGSGASGWWLLVPIAAGTGFCAWVMDRPLADGPRSAFARALPYLGLMLLWPTLVWFLFWAHALWEPLMVLPYAAIPVFPMLWFALLDRSAGTSIASS